MVGVDGIVQVRQVAQYRKVRDLDEAVQWYTRGLGYEVCASLAAHGKVFWADLQNGASRVVLSNRLVHGRSDLMWLYVDDADSAYRHLQRAGYAPETMPANQPHGTREFVVEDRDGLAFVIAHRL